MTFTRRVLRGCAAALLATPAVAFAQGPTATGLGPLFGADPNYMISVDGGPLSSAFVLDRTTGGTRFAGASASGSLPGGAPDGTLSRFGYSFQTTFTGGSVTSFSYQCAIDDVFTSVVLNGVAVPGGCDQYNFGAVYTVYGVVPGLNTLAFNGAGNGVTDGLAVNVVGVTLSTAPEPSSWALMAAGLLLVGGAAVRRRARVG